MLCLWYHCLAGALNAPCSLAQLVTCLRHLKTWMRPANIHPFPVHTVRHYLRSLTTFHDMDAESAEILNMFKTVRPRCDFPRIATTFRIVTTSHDLPLHTVRLFDVANGVFRHREESLPCRRSKVVQWAPGFRASGGFAPWIPPGLLPWTRILDPTP